MGNFKVVANERDTPREGILIEEQGYGEFIKNSKEIKELRF